MFKKVVIAGLILSIALFTGYFIVDFIQEPQSLNQQIRKEAGGKSIQLSKGVVNYEWLGDKTRPIVILVGGGGLGYNVWDKNIDSLISHGFSVLRYDHYGRGYSDKVDEKYTLNLFYRQFTELLDSLKIKKPFHLMGLSMGAMVAMKYAVEVPENVRKLVLIDPAGVHPFKAPVVLKTPVISKLLMTFYWRPKAIESQITEFYQPKIFPEYREELEKQIKLKGYKDVQNSIWLNTLSIEMTKEIIQLGRSKKEIMLIWGRQDPRTLFESSEYYLKAIPTIEFLPVDKAGHLSNYERPDIVNPALCRFLQD